MEHTSSDSHEFHSWVDRLEDVQQEVDANPRLRLAPEAEDFIDVQRERRKTLKAIEHATGQKFSVTHESSNKYAAAFVDTHTWKPYIAAKTLDSREKALHAARHEKEHMLNKVTAVPALEKLTLPERVSLERALGEELFDAVSLMEGFNDGSTELKYGKGPSGLGYPKEIEQAFALDGLARKYRLPSLMTSFRRGDLDEIMSTLRLIAQQEQTGGRVHQALNVKLSA